MQKTPGTANNDHHMLGYIEGYYGRLFSWPERNALLHRMADLGLNTWLYAPKEDSRHRFVWREPYDEQWRKQFRQFCSTAQRLGIAIVAGVAPGLDFDFTSFTDGEDFSLLCEKSKQLREDGATSITLLMDDINDDFDLGSCSFGCEGEAHAALANVLAEELGESVMVVPRIYAGEMEPAAPDYADAFIDTLHRELAVFHCGSHIVSQSMVHADFSRYAKHAGRKLVAWDNLYANDYCPRKLYVGAWTGRSTLKDVLLNPTGLPHTDALLLDVMHTGLVQAPGDAAETREWQSALRRHGVPDAFFCVADYFYHPPFKFTAAAVNSTLEQLAQRHPVRQQIAAIDELLWRWKTPLSREWYPFLFGLKQDLQQLQYPHSNTRLIKTQLAPLAAALASE